MKITSQDIQEATKQIKLLIKKCYVRDEKSKKSFRRIVEENCKKYKFTYLGNGVYRIALKYKNLVVKINRTLGDSYVILEEVESWEEIKKLKYDYIKALFNPILHHEIIKFRHKGKMIEQAFSISPLVETIDENDYGEQFDTIRMFADNMFSDCHSGNYGIVNKLPIIIDYQSTDILFFNPKNVPVKVKKILTKHYAHIKKLSHIAPLTTNK